MINLNKCSISNSFLKIPFHSNDRNYKIARNKFNKSETTYISNKNEFFLKSMKQKIWIRLYIWKDLSIANMPGLYELTCKSNSIPVKISTHFKNESDHLILKLI